MGGLTVCLCPIRRQEMPDLLPASAPQGRFPHGSALEAHKKELFLFKCRIFRFEGTDLFLLNTRVQREI